MSLFNKAVIFSDTHFGRQSNAPQANQDNIEFLRWAIDEARTWGADTCIMLGDWFDNRASVGVQTMHASLAGLEMLSTAFARSWFITGNHDQFHRHQRDITSIEFVRHVPNITVINDPLVIDDAIFLPWLMPDEHKTLDLRGRYVFGHLEVPGFLRNTKSIMPETSGAPDCALFDKLDFAFTGHFHLRQMQRNVCYIGNVFPFDFRDENDAERGIMLLQWGHEPIFRAWPLQPLYRSIRLSELLDTTDRVLKPNMTVRVLVDMSLKYEEAQEMRELLVNAYGLRKIELSHVRDDADQDVENDIEFQTVDQLVLASLQDIESVGLSNGQLISIYQSLIL